MLSRFESLNSSAIEGAFQGKDHLSLAHLQLSKLLGLIARILSVDEFCQEELVELWTLVREQHLKCHIIQIGFC